MRIKNFSGEAKISQISRKPSKRTNLSTSEVAKKRTIGTQELTKAKV